MYAVGFFAFCWIVKQSSTSSSNFLHCQVRTKRLKSTARRFTGKPLFLAEQIQGNWTQAPQHSLFEFRLHRKAFPFFLKSEVWAGKSKKWHRVDKSLFSHRAEPAQQLKYSSIRYLIKVMLRYNVRSIMWNFLALFFQQLVFASYTREQWRRQLKNWWEGIWGGKMLVLRRITLFCLEKRLSKHKKTIFSKIWGAHGPFRLPWLHLCT